MSHNLNENGRRMFYTGERPWHGLGTKVEEPLTAKEAIEVSKLDYTVECQPIYLSGEREIESRLAIVRADTQAVLGLVSEKYKIVQNRDAFSFFDTLVGEGQAIYESAGALGLGERVWIMAKLPDDIIVGKDDVVEKYLILTTSHDGKSSVKVYFSPVRVICQNTLNFSFSQRSDCINIPHLGNINSKIDEARKVLGISINVYAQFERIANQLADVKLNTAQVEAYYNQLLFGQAVEDKEQKILLNQRNDLLALFESGKGNDKADIKHSAWTAYNAVTEYVDHHRTIRGVKEDATNRLKNIWFGSGASLKRKALDGILEVAEIKVNKK